MKAGDAVTTTVMLEGRVCAVQAVIESVFDECPQPGFYWRDGVVMLPNATATVCEEAHGCFIEDEGVTWLRGWQPHGEATEALLAGVALGAAQGAVPTHTFDRDYSSTEYAFDRYYTAFDDYLADDHPVYKDD